jgi:hypothetical protein
MGFNDKCPICEGLCVVKYFDFAKYAHIQNGTYYLNDLIDKYGEFGLCPDCIGLTLN